MPYIVRSRNRRLASRLRTFFTGITGVSWSVIERDSLSSPLSWGSNLFLAMPRPSLVKDSPPQYSQMFEFYRAHKRGQWHRLRDFFPTPEIGKPPYVVRPLRHEHGIGFEVTDTLPDEARAATHYWRSLWRRNSEYRVIYAHGQPVVTLLKRVPSGTDQKIAWSAGVSSFVTVHERDNDRLRYTDFYTRATKFLEAHPFPLIAFDVLFRAKKFVVVEVNFNPGILIEPNLERLTEELMVPYV